ncbi:MAG: hypothetical protein KC549_11935, partial [Myxococcales bacterium]|nr:hypothetical protein [Myxococcales bacterium]
MRALVLLLVWWVAGVAVAADVMLEGTPDEQAALQLNEQGKYIESREKAQEILNVTPDSFIATYVMAGAYFNLEANLPRALFTLRRAMKLLEDRYGLPIHDQAAEVWHRRLLSMEIWILSDMDDREGQLQVLARYNDLYKPPKEVHKMWPLLKLRRYDEAIAIGEKLIYSDLEYERRRAYNGLMAVEDERRNRQASYEWGLKGYA